MKPLVLTGKVFGRLAVLALGSPQGQKRRWLCECVCGVRVEVATSNLTGGHTKSCGCMSRDVNSERATKRNTVHGHNRAGRGNQSPTWHSWSSMLKRCRNERHVSYRGYGGRGIAVCDRWASFANFLADMGERPAGKTLDRKDVNGNYEPSNCRWATPSEQQRNRRISVRP